MILEKLESKKDKKIGQILDGGCTLFLLRNSVPVLEFVVPAAEKTRHKFDFLRTAWLLCNIEIDMIMLGARHRREMHIRR